MHESETDAAVDETGPRGSLSRVVRPTSVGLSVYRSLRSAITGGRLLPGAELVTTELAKQLGVSRTPVRDAVLRLQTEGLVEPNEAGVMAVRKVGVDEVMGIMAIRAELDAYAAREFVKRRDGHRVVEDLERIVAAMREVGTDRGRADEQLVLNEDFHRAIRDGSGNAVLAPLVDNAGSLSLRTLVAQLRRRTSIERNISEHETILDALANGSEDEADAAARTHVASATEELLHLLGQAAPSGGPVNLSQRHGHDDVAEP